MDSEYPCDYCYDITRVYSCEYCSRKCCEKCAKTLENENGRMRHRDKNTCIKVLVKEIHKLEVKVMEKKGLLLEVSK